LRVTLVTSLMLEPALEADAPAIAALRLAVADRLTERFGHGPWSAGGSERGVLNLLRSASMFVARRGGDVIATVRLAPKKPWAIDRTCFSPAECPLYLTDMAVAPIEQGHGVGTRCLDEARRLVAAWPGDAIRLDAYDAPAGAGAFYRKCGFREVGRATYRGTPLVYFETPVIAPR
jgi:GNAT superfamily N-acetyltransferase